MKTLWNDADRAALVERIGRLEPASPARWGRMRAPQMLAHLIQSMRMATGQLPVARVKLPVRFTPLKQLVIYLLPFPRGTPTAPELLARTPAAWPTEVAELHTELDGFARRPRDAAWPDHPAFGALSGAQWGVLQYRHIDHHLRQFGA